MKHDRIEYAATELRATGRYGSEAAEVIADVAPILLRVVRDDLVMAWQAGTISDLLDAEYWLNNRIRALTEQNTTTGDTT